MDVRVPDLGDFADVEVIEVLVKPGDIVRKEDPLITLETEKATMDVPSPADGTVRALKVAVGGTVSTGDLIVVLDSEAAEPTQTIETPPAEDSAADLAATVVRAGPPAEERTARQARPAEPLLVTVPDLGDFHDVEVIELLVAPGDTVAAEEGLVTLETEKAAMDVPAPAAGTVLELRVRTGSRVNAGDAIAVLAPAAAGAERAAEAGDDVEKTQAMPAPPPAPDARPPPAATAATPVVAIDEAAFSRAHASPSVRKLARELGVDLGRVAGSGRKGRVTADDVKAYVKRILTGGAPGGGALPAVPEIDFAKFGPVERQPLSRIQRISGPRLHASWVNVPHVTQHDDADITQLEEERNARKEEAAKHGIRLTPLAFIMRACVLTLAEFPTFKSSLSADGQSLVMKGYTHVGFAADTPNGLVVPVIRDADRKGVDAIAVELAELSARAREGKLKAADIQGGVFTISSLGGIGGSYFTPIINAPEVAILGVSRSRWQAVLDGERFVPRLMLPLSLSYDHRVIDGAQAARFITALSHRLADPASLLEAPQ